jgi:predicted permease
MFSIVDAVLLRPLPFADQKSIDVIWKEDPRAGHYVEELAYPELRDLQENIREFEFVAVMPTSLYGYARVLETAGHDPVQIESTPVSHDFFRVLGVMPVLGRNFEANDERVGAPPVVMVSDRVWREHLGSDPHIVGRMLRLNGSGYTVIGVMGRGVEFPRGAGFWYPLGVDENVVTRRGATFLQAIARVRRGVSHQRVAGEVDALVRRLAVEHPEAYPPSQRARVTPLVEYWTGSSRPQLWILLGTSILLLGAAILNACTLILSGVLGRRTEMATRVALGAQSRQILALLGAEGSVIAAFAAVGGVALAELALRCLLLVAPPDIPRLDEAAINGASLAFAIGAAALAAVVCMLLPGLAATRMPLDAVLREGGTRLSLSRRGVRLRNLFVLAQGAVTVLVLAVAGLFLLSYRSTMGVDTGFAHRDAVTMNLQLRGPGLLASKNMDAETRRAFYTQLLERLRTAPGVTSAAAVLLRPMEGAIGWERSYEFEFEAGRKDSAILPKANYEVVTPDYFRTVGTALLEGRDFTAHDSAASEGVVIVSRNLADRIRAAGYAPVGYRLRMGGDAWLKIIAVCADARYRSVTQEDADLYVPYLQAQAPTHYVVIRGTRPPAELTQLVTRTVAQMAPGQAVASPKTIAELSDANTARQRFNLILLLWFGACAAVLAAMGIYGVIAEALAARQQEIAIRTALGASPVQLVKAVVAKPLIFVLSGELLGLCLLALAKTWISGLLYGVKPYDPALPGTVFVFVFGLSLAAAVIAFLRRMKPSGMARVQ